MEAESVAALSKGLDETLDRLQTALAKLGGADAPSQQFGDPAAGRALALMAAGIQSPETVQMETPALHQHLQRLFALFATGGGEVGGASSVGSTKMSALGFRKLVRAAQLTSEKCQAWMLTSSSSRS